MFLLSFESHKEWFQYYVTYNVEEAFLGDNSSHHIVCKGKVNLYFNDGRVKNLNGVLYVSILLRNIIFVSNLNESKSHVTFDKSSYNLDRGI